MYIDFLRLPRLPLFAERGYGSYIHYYLQSYFLIYLAIKIPAMKKSFFSVVILTVGIGIASISCHSDKESKTIGLNQNIHHDDFEYSVTSYTKTPEIISGQDTIKARGIFYLVHFKVTNNALRVGHTWDNSIAYLIDANGDRYQNLPDKQKALNNSLPFGLNEIYNTPHGAADTTILVFELPADVIKPYLKVSGGTLMGDVFDAGRFRRMKVRLF
jgi:hypothetical protein